MKGDLKKNKTLRVAVRETEWLEYMKSLTPPTYLAWNLDCSPSWLPLLPDFLLISLTCLMTLMSFSSPPNLSSLSCVVYAVIPLLSTLPCICALPSLWCLSFPWVWGWGGATLPGADGVRKPSGPWKVSDLDIVVDPVPPPLPETHVGSGASTGSDSMSCECTPLHKQKEALSEPEPSPWTAHQDLQHALKPFLHPRSGWFQYQHQSNWPGL